jgi:phasin family protein
MNLLQPTSFPFPKTEPTTAWFALPSLNIGALSEVHRKNAAAVTSANQAAFDGLKTLTQRQADLFKTTVEDYSKLSNDMLASASFDDKVTKQADAAQHIYQSTMTQFRELCDIAVKANVTAIDILNARVTEAFDEFTALFAVAPSTATSVAPASAITDPGAVVDEVDTVRQEVAEVEREPLVAAPTAAPKAAVPAAKAGRRPTARP